MHAVPVKVVEHVQLLGWWRLLLGTSCYTLASPTARTSAQQLDTTHTHGIIVSSDKNYS